MGKDKTTIGLVFGGDSLEHLVSIKSAKTVLSALRKGENLSLFEVINIYIDRNGAWWSGSVADQVLDRGLEPQEKLGSVLKKGLNQLPKGIEKIDVWFPVLHGPNGEDGTVQGLFKLTGKPFVGSGVLGSALGMDKIAMKAAFQSAGLPQIDYLATNKYEISNNNCLEELVHKVELRLGYPSFVKPANLGSSVGISKVKSKEELKEGLKFAATLDDRILVEKSVVARELECGVLGTEKMEASTVGEVSFKSDWYDYKAKYSEGLSNVTIPAKVSEETIKTIQGLSLIACKAICAKGIARVDFFYESLTKKIWINEINTLPGFTKQSMYPMLWEASGLSLEKLVAKLVESARE